MKRPKPKFRVGQVVFIRNHGWYRKLVRTSYDPDRRDGWFMCDDGFVRHQSRMRALTARERGKKGARGK